jgi:hypothetical protein
MRTFLLQNEVYGINVGCADCGAVLLRNLPDVRTAYCRTGELGSHLCAQDQSTGFEQQAPVQRSPESPF